MKKEMVWAAFCLLVLVGGMILSINTKPKTSLIKEATVTLSRGDRYKDASSLGDIPSEGFEIMKSLEGYSFRLPSGAPAIKETFVYAEAFEKGFARVEVRNSVLNRTEFKVIDREGEIIDQDQVPPGLGWDRIQMKENRKGFEGYREELSEGINYYVGPAGNLAANPSRGPGVSDPGKNTSHSIVTITQDEVMYFGGRTYQEGSTSNREEVFLSGKMLKEINLDLRFEEPTFWVTTQEGENFWILDIEVTAFLRDPDFKPSLGQPKDHFGPGGIFEDLSPEEVFFEQK